MPEYSDWKGFDDFLFVAILSGQNLATSRETNVKRQACKLFFIIEILPDQQKATQ